MFIRVKRIYGNEYAYLVTQSWTDRGPRQKVSKYLGKIIRPKKTKSESLAGFLGLTEQKLGEWINKTGFNEIATELIKLELGNHDMVDSFKLEGQNAEILDGKGKKVVIALNDGFMCQYTAEKLLKYDAAADYSGYNLADALTAAGITVDKEVFISLFGKVQATAKMPENKKEPQEFYY